MLSLDDLLAAQTTEQFETAILDALEALNLSARSWEEGSITRTMVRLVATLFASADSIRATTAAGGFLDTASGNWLSLVASYVYNVDRVEAESAVGSIRLTNSTANVYTLSPGDLVVANGTTGKTYTLTQAGTIPANASQSLAFIADEVGTDSNATPGQINQLVTPLSGVTCTNLAAVLGTDEETDVSLRDRCRLKLGSLSPDGPASAYEYVAKSAGVGVTRTRIVESEDFDGMLTLYIAGASGAMTGGQVIDVNTQIQTLAVPIGITATVASAVSAPINLNVTVYVYDDSGITSADLADRIELAVAEYLATVPIGGDIVTGDVGRVYGSRLYGVIESVSSRIFRVDMTGPGDVDLAASEVPLLGSSSVTVITEAAP